MQPMVELYYRARYPDIEILLRQSGRVYRYPTNSSLPEPVAGWTPTSGIMTTGGRFYLWCFAKIQGGDITIAAPLTGAFLADLVPGLGAVDFAAARPGRGQISGVVAAERIPRAINRFDRELTWFATIPTWDWEHPGRTSPGYLNVRSRLSAVTATVFNRNADTFQDVLVNLLIINVIVFFVVEVIVVIIGITMTRSITGAVHRLYEGTRKIMAGDFSHRIEVKGKDQLADLGVSFNQMTSNMQRLLEVAREKERLQSEIEIAREVQNQLYPRQVPASRTLRLTAVCQPARMVSGDYYDYETMREAQIALAIGDVAGKGISAALLMATLQSSLRTQLQTWREIAAGGNGAYPRVVSTSSVVSHLNSQLYSYTSLEKYATFCLGVYDEPSGSFTYTNAGHLPPLLVRGGESVRLDVNGTVVGAFPTAPYDESRVELQAGDLLVFFSDGVTEPENEYGEMFGEDRFTDLVCRNSHLSEDKIVELVISSVRQWTASEELQDDMTLLLAKRL
jgi:sigma-B regulation protein RsbU (phosphoserine phosphatase)